MRSGLTPEVKRIGDIARETFRDLSEFEAWCNERLGRTPAASKLLTFAAAWQRIQTTANI